MGRRCRHDYDAMQQFDDGTYEMIGCAMHVHRSLGSGLREKPYENAMMVALRKAKIRAVQQLAYPIRYEDEVVGDCVPDITSGDILIEVKAVDSLGESETAQLLNYLRIAGKQVGLLINFKNPTLEWKRVVL